MEVLRRHSKDLDLCNRMAKVTKIVSKQTHRRTSAASPTRQRQHRLNPDEIAQLVAQYQAGCDMNTLAAEWGVHRTTVAGHVRRADVPLRRQGLTPEQLSEATQLYAAGWSCQRLADLFTCDDETVRRGLRSMGVRLRRPWIRPRGSRDSPRGAGRGI